MACGSPLAEFCHLATLTPRGPPSPIGPPFLRLQAPQTGRRLALEPAGGRLASMRPCTAPFRGHGGFVRSPEARGWLVV
jgi:hypothetical protein